MANIGELAVETLILEDEVYHGCSASYGRTSE